MIYRRKNRQNEIVIELEDVVMIMGKNYPDLDVFLHSAFCTTCSGQTTIRKFKMLLDDTNDIILDGSCASCNSSVTRYIETGESRSSSSIAAHIRVVKTISQK